MSYIDNVLRWATTIEVAQWKVVALRCQSYFGDVGTDIAEVTEVRKLVLPTSGVKTEVFSC